MKEIGFPFHQAPSEPSDLQVLSGQILQLSQQIQQLDHDLQTTYTALEQTKTEFAQSLLIPISDRLEQRLDEQQTLLADYHCMIEAYEQAHPSGCIDIL